MARYFAPISIADLAVKIDALGDDAGIVDKFKDDLKVSFDTENFDFDNKHLCGYHTLMNGLTFRGISSGGDWEYPVFFIIYWDGKKLRAYVPTDGNPWNTQTKQAFGITSIDILTRDYKLIEQDIMARILPKGQQAKPKKPVKKSKTKKTLQERIEDLVFFGTGDEAYELFQKMCSLAYSLVGLGFDEEAETVVVWAEDHAHASQDSFLENMGRTDLIYNKISQTDMIKLAGSDHEKGYWGN